LGNIATITFGLQTKDKDTYVKNIKIDNEWELCYTGRDISRYY
ncbi:Type IIS restriction enzyme Eco57I, partial [termite gut metagenome]